MRTNIVIDDRLMERAQALSGLQTKREAVEEGLRLLVRLKEQERIRTARGKLPWDGDLDAMRCALWDARISATGAACMSGSLSRETGVFMGCLLRQSGQAARWHCRKAATYPPAHDRGDFEGEGRQPGGDQVRIDEDRAAGLVRQELAGEGGLARAVGAGDDDDAFVHRYAVPISNLARSITAPTAVRKLIPTIPEISNP